MSLRKLVHEMLEATYNGQKIRVEGWLTFYTDLKGILSGKFTNYKLTIGDGQSTELSAGVLGIYCLKGSIPNGSKEPSKVEVIIDQGLLGTKYTLTVDDQEYKLKKL